MKVLTALTLLSVLTVSHVWGQPVALQPPSQLRVESDRPSILHVTDILNERPEAKRALESFHEARRLGLEPAGKSGAVRYEVGAQRDFYVFAYLDDEDRVLKTFEKKAESAVANIWVEVEELQKGEVSEEVLSSLGYALLSGTPERSYNAGRGIVSNNNEIFGSPPDVDGDGVVDILLYAIGSRQEGTLIAGYVWSGDMCTTANSATLRCDPSESNKSDVLYLNTYPLSRSGSDAVEDVAGTAAHEYQHLIHFNYDLDEETFVNEGLSEWAERLNGYRPRNITYLSSASERNLSFFTWRRTSTRVLNDYQRAGLFTTYLAERIGPEATGSITRRRENGAFGYAPVVEGTAHSLGEVMLNFHTANLLNDLSIGDDGLFGYRDPHLQNVRGAVGESQRIDGRTTSRTDRDTLEVKGGGSIWLSWAHVEDFQLSLDLVYDPVIQGSARARAVLMPAGGGIEVVEIVPGDTPTVFTGKYDEIVLIAAHVSPVLTADTSYPWNTVDFEYSASWAGDVQLSTETIQYDDGRAQNFFLLSSDGSGVVATEFASPGPTAGLGRVFLAPYFLNQFNDTGVGPEAPRDILLQVWAEDENGHPGEVLLSKEISDQRAYSAASTTLDFFSIDLSSEIDGPLPDKVFVGYSDAGSDDNYVVIGPTRYEQENVSFVSTSNTGGWNRLWDVELSSSNTSLEGHAVPIRVEFVIGVEVDAERNEEVPSAMALDQNFPNPFNPSTSIGYVLPAAQHVRIKVYDVTGRLVSMLVDAEMPPGSHSVRFDGSMHPSGVYLYVLETDNERIARKMLLVK